MEQRLSRVMSKRNISREEAQKIINKVDEGRERYINKYTGTSRYDTRNYDLVISMNGLSVDDAVDIIIDYIEKGCRE